MTPNPSLVHPNQDNHTPLRGVSAHERAPARVPRATRIPQDWRPSETACNWTLQRVDRATAALELEKFRNYWTALGGAKAAKLDWDATWRNWILTSHGNGNGGTPARTNGVNQPAPTGTGAKVAGWLALANNQEILG